MTLPNYFLADLPREAPLTPAMVSAACQTLKRNRDQYLRPRSTASIVKILHTLGDNWRQDDYPFRQIALDRGPAATGFSAATLKRGLDAFFSQLTDVNLNALITQELGHGARFDQFGPSSAENFSRRLAITTGPVLQAHIAAGNIPAPAFMSLVLGLLTRSAQFVKCASGGSLLPTLFAHSIYDTEPKLATCIELAEWEGGDEALEAELFAEADCVTATGSDEALGAVRARLPVGKRFVGYGDRVSFGFIAQEALQGYGVKKLAVRAAMDVTAWDQLGCLSPHVFYVETGGAIPPEQFAELLAAELANLEKIEPRGEIAMEESAAIANRRGFYQVRSASQPESTRLWSSENSTAWTVVFESEPLFQLSCLNRFVYVKQVPDLDSALRYADSVRGKVSTVGLAATDERAEKIAAALAQWGVTRICPIGQMQSPSLLWRHDGRPALAELVTWTDWEQ